MSIHIIEPSEDLYTLLKYFEGCKLHAYECETSLSLSKIDPKKAFYTIGFGNTYYENGDKIKSTDVITEERALNLLKLITKTFSEAVDKYTRDDINVNMFNSLISLSYNIGLENFKNSTLLKLVNKNPLDYENITKEFLKWNRSAGIISNGLLRRRKIEAKYYSTGIIDFLLR